MRRMLIRQWCQEMESKEIDMVISPTTIGEEPTRISDVVGAAKSSRSPVYEFKMDYYSAFPNSLGIPSVTLPI